MSFQAIEVRTIECPICKKKETEPFFGMGFPNWLRLMDIIDPEKKINPILCPECHKLLLEWLNGNAKLTVNEKSEGVDK